MADHRKRLAEGDLRFERIDGTLKHMDEKLSTIVGVLKWVGGAIGLGLLSTGGAAFLWVIVHMGKGA